MIPRLGPLFPGGPERDGPGARLARIGRLSNPQSLRTTSNAITGTELARRLVMTLGLLTCACGEDGILSRPRSLR